MQKKLKGKNKSKSQHEPFAKVRSCPEKGDGTSRSPSERKGDERRGGCCAASGSAFARAVSARSGAVDFDVLDPERSAASRSRQMQEEAAVLDVAPERKRKVFAENGSPNLGLPTPEFPLSFQDSGKKPKYRDFFEGSSENFMLKKTKEITNFNVDIYNEGVGVKCPEKETTLETGYPAARRAFGESASPEQELQMCMVNERSVKGPSRGPPGRSRGPAARSRRQAPDEPEKVVRRTSSSKKFLFNKDRIVNYFFQKGGGKAKTSFRRSSAREEKPRLVDDDLMDTEENRKEDLRIKEYLREFYFYLLFLILVTFVGTSMVSQDMFYFTDETASIFYETPNFPYLNVSDDDLLDLMKAEKKGWLSYAKKTLKQSNTYSDFWAFAESTMLDMFYWDFYYSYIDPIAPTTSDDRKMFYSNQLLGVPRMRQVRVRNDSCQIHPDVQRFFRSCYYYYSVFSEETGPIREDMGGTITASAWVYTEAVDLDSTLYWGDISVYGGGGYYVDLSKYKNQSMRMVRHLKENLWLSRSTRAIFIDFNLYNANVNLFCLCKIVCEFPPVGGMVPKVDFISLKLIQYLTIYDFFVLGIELVLILFVGYYTYETIMTIKAQKSAIFFSWWSYVDIFMLLISYAYVALSIVLFIFTSELISKLSEREDEYTDFNFVKSLKVNCNNLLALLLFAAWVKLYRFLKFSIVMVEFRRTLARSVKDIIGFLPMFMILFVAFALLAYLIFGTQVKHYSTIWFSFLSLLEAFLGGFQYREIQESNHILGPIFYIGFIFFIFFVLLNVFVAIINDAYSAVKAEVIADIPQTGQYLKRGLLNFVGISCCHLDRRLEKKSKIKKEMVMRKIMRTLRQAGFSDLEIRIFFSKYKINMNNILEAETQRKIIEDLELKKIDFSENAEQFQIKTLRRRINSLNERIEQMEGNLQPVIDKVDVLIKRL